MQNSKYEPFLTLEERRQLGIGDEVVLPGQEVLRCWSRRGRWSQVRLLVDRSGVVTFRIGTHRLAQSHEQKEVMIQASLSTAHFAR